MRRAVVRRLSAVLAHLDPDAPRVPAEDALDGADANGGGPEPALGALEPLLHQLELSTDRTRDRLDEADTTRRRLVAALEQVAQGVVISDAAGDVVYRNWPASSFVGGRHSEALAQQMLKELLAAAVAGETREQTLELFSPPRRTLTIRATPLIDRESVLGAVAIIEDVSERRRLE